MASATPAARDEYGLADLAGTPTGIDAVVLVAQLAHSDARARTMRASILSGSSRVTGATVSPPVSPSGGYNETIAHTDPDTGVAWTPVGVDAQRAEIEIVA